jgi:small-conductance mechanosensitive channel
MADTLHIVEQMKVENSKLAEQLVTVAKEREKLQEMMRVQTESFEKKMAEIERSNQETAKMLEARTLEVTKLQNRLQALPKSQRKPKAESGNAKKKP